MGALVKAATGTGPGSIILHTRSIVRSSNGNRWILIYDGPNFELWRSTDEGVTWGLHLSKAVTLNTFSTYSMTIGANNNLHIVYRNAAGDIKYFKGTWSGTTYTFGSEETVAATGATNIGRFDVECPTGDVVIVAGIEFQTKGRLKYFVRTTGNTWVNFRTVDLTTASTFTGYQSISLARDESITTGNVRYNCVVTTPDTTVFNGDLIEMGGTVNPATGAAVTAPLQKTVNTSTSKADLRDYALFFSYANNIEYCSMTGRTVFVPSVGRFNSTGWVVLPSRGPDQRVIAARGGSGQAYWLQVAFACAGQDTKGDGVAVGMVFRGPALDGKIHSWYISARLTAQRATWNAPNYAFTADQWDLDTTDEQLIWMGWGNPRNYSQIALTWHYRSGDASYYTVWNKTLAGTAYTPSVLSPATSATVATNKPTLKGTLAGETKAKSRQRAVYQVASDAAFSSNLRTIWETQAEAQAIPLPNQTSQSGGASQAVFTETLGDKTAGDAIRQGVWYWRLALVDNWGRQQPYSSSASFTNSHPPAATVIDPANLKKIAYQGSGPVDFSWLYSSSSPGSQQTAYQVIIEQNSDGTTVTDTGKITSANPTVTINIASALKSVVLRWKVKVWDEDDVQGSFSQYGLFEVADPSTVVVNAPLSGSTVDNPTPSIGWAVSPPAADPAIHQRKFRVLLTENVSGSTIYDSGWLVGTAPSYSIPTGYVQNNGTYTVTVQIEDDNGLVSSDTDAFLTAWTPPAAPPFSVTVTSYTTLGYVQVAWTNAAKDSDFVSWRVYRRAVGDQVWELLTENPIDTATYVWNDYSACSGVSYQYAVVQTANRFGSLIESVYNTVTVAPKTDDYWLIDLDPTLGSKFKLNNVTADSYTDEYESETINIIGKGRKLDEGTHWGLNGSLVAKLYDDATQTARQKRQIIMGMRSAQRLVYLRTPFGDFYPVSVGNLQVSRVAGVGNREFVEITVPYLEVAEQA